MKYIISLFLSCTPLVVMSSLYATTISTNSTFCTADYAPVCGSLQVQCIKAPCNPIQQTFPNKCMAQAASATQITSGACVSPKKPIKMTVRGALMNGTWSISTLNGKPVTSSGTMEFGDRIFIAKLCNSMRGSYGILGERLFIREAISTMMYCDGNIMSVENMLTMTGSRFMVGSDTLTITTKKGDTMVWKKK